MGSISIALALALRSSLGLDSPEIGCSVHTVHHGSCAEVFLGQNPILFAGERSSTRRCDRRHIGTFLHNSDRFTGTLIQRGLWLTRSSLLHSVWAQNHFLGQQSKRDLTQCYILHIFARLSYPCNPDKFLALVLLTTSEFDSSVHGEKNRYINAKVGGRLEEECRKRHMQKGGNDSYHIDQFPNADRHGGLPRHSA